MQVENLKETGSLFKDVEGKKTLRDIEELVRVQTKRKRIETAILGSLSLAGFLAAVVVAPNAISVLQKVLPDVRPLSQKQSVKNAIGRLIRKGYIKKSNNKYYITSVGENRLESLVLQSQAFTLSNSEKSWDKKWRIVIYDIPEIENKKRNALRDVLVQTGFVKLQDSVWVYPFRCDEIVALLKFNLKLGRRAVYIIADAIEGDEWLREYFQLPGA
ncbi:TPA: CRISPR-associated endonuclease Cas2 [Patescibacteria group bacterium]|nr:MAG: hypothetical protein UU98_C0018G0024 [Parcubacteria group bacterium GW2011_GWD2_42_14]HCC05252.1 CRISPR-associated endonuclease Cas2 [Patescibacteria group bacterium]